MNPARLVVRAAGLAHTELAATHYAVFGTLTYRPGAPWGPKQISSLMTLYRNTVRRARPGSKVSYIWVVEPHADGRPHYHYVIWIPKGVRVPKPDEAGWWPHGSTNVQVARNPGGYLAKYLKKGLRKPVLIEGRFRRYAVQVKNAWVSRMRLPQWLQYFSRVGETWRRVRRLPGRWSGGWVRMSDGLYYASPYVWHRGEAQWVGWHADRPAGVFDFVAWCEA